jgi:heme-degrading monooxygenase HmoA
MFAVIFRAEIALLDDQYLETAEALRERAINDYGCQQFTAWTEGNREVAISYWNSLEQIANWKADPAHQQAQQEGRDRWYKHYSVQVVEVLHEYGH